MIDTYFRKKPIKWPITQHFFVIVCLFVLLKTVAAPMLLVAVKNVVRRNEN